LVLALKGRTSSGTGFSKVVKMIDNMVTTLKTEQEDDDHKREYCSMQKDLVGDKVRALKRVVAGKSADISSGQESIAVLAQEIVALEAGINSLDKAVATATEDRKQENKDYKALMASDTAAKELLLFAKNRLNKFYNQKLYKAAAKAEFSSEDRIYSNLGGKVTTAAPGGIADTGVAVFAQISSHEERLSGLQPPPETWDAYASKSEQGVGVIAMLDLLVKDLDKEMTEAKTGEQDAQADYKQLMKYSAEKRKTDSAALTERSSAKADMEAELQTDVAAKKSGVKELMATQKYALALHSECDWLMQYYEVRKEARVGEVESLKNARAVLSGADYSLLQMRSIGFLRRS